MPRPKFDRFSFNENNRAPFSYSLQYHIEGEMGGSDMALSQTTFIDLAAHYETLTVHYVQELGDGNNSWVVVTENDRPLAETPRRTNELEEPTTS
jgi:hypothetical protein